MVEPRAVAEGQPRRLGGIMGILASPIANIVLCALIAVSIAASGEGRQPVALIIYGLCAFGALTSGFSLLLERRGRTQ